ncbi:putative cyclase-domain-containing protein [Papiliotrema laurentii]|uniref:Cyclase-domain-containing protein n=1 Tax=Papiliotrema laurentii TaxID=5418 RepID=A0AAD9L5Y4_PAPLA|nr:putative cyclase-domain-containing protein [Papiliotrema laurentii]
MSVPHSTVRFADLPLQRPGPPFNAWGLYGPDDELGRLNLITPESVQRARDAIKQGVSVNLNLPMSSHPLHPARPKLEHEIKNRVHANDDQLSFNTQTSTQIDGFRHYPYQNYPREGEYLFYGGMSSDEAKNPGVLRNGIQNFAKRPINSRGHLLDIALYLQHHGLPPLSPFDASTPISASLLQSCAEWHGVEFLPGDILLLRTGFTEAFSGLGENQRIGFKDKEDRGSCGVSPDEQVLQWHWDRGIAAVMTDTVAYEVTPFANKPSIHEVFLAGWGLPIGELLDLRELSQKCREAQQYTFMFTCAPLYVNGGIASPANASAIL